MKTGAPLLSPMLLSKGAMHTLKVVSGNTAMLDVGKLMESSVQKAEANTFRIMLKGETFIIRGLPASMLGRNINILAQYAGNRLELLWLASSVSEKSAMATNQQAGEANGKTTSPTGEKVSLSSSPSGNRIITGSQASGKQGLKMSAGNGKTFKTTMQGEAFSLKGRTEAVVPEKVAHTPFGRKTIMPKAHQAQIFSSIPESLLKAGTLTGRVISIEGKRMSLQLAATDSTTAKTIKILITEHIHGLKNGQSISARIQTGSNHKPVLEIQNQAGHLKPEVRQMNTGEMTIALVQKRLSNGNIQLNIAGKVMEAPAPAAIKRGDALMLRMNKHSELEVMQIHKDMGQKALTALRNHLPTSSPTAQSLTAIRNLVPAMAAGELADIDGLNKIETWVNAAGSSKDETVNGPRLAALIRDSGLHLESKLMTLLQHGKLDFPLGQDLKAILLQIADLQPDKIHNAVLARTLIEMAQQGASRIEAGQALNILANIQSEPYRFEFPMLINQQITNVQLSFEQNNSGDQHGDEGNEDSTGSSYNVLFALELSQLGKLRVDANISEHSVYARIYNGNIEMQHFIQQHIHRLETRLHDLGYAEVYLSISGKQPDSEKQARFDQLTTMTPAKFSLLDIRA